MEGSAATVEPAEALAGFEAALDRLIASATDPLTGLISLDHEAQTRFLRLFERGRNRMAVIDHAVVTASEATGLADHHCMRSTAVMLQSLLNLSGHEAHARGRAAEQLVALVSATGEQLGAQRPVLAAAVAGGHATPAQTDQVLRGLARLDKLADLTEAQRSTADRVLAEHARILPPRELGRLVDRIRDHIDPDGALVEQDYLEATRRLEWQVCRDGSLRVEGRLTPEAGQKLRAVLEPLSRLQDTPDLADTRSLEQRRHDALESVLDRTLRAGTTPSVGGMPACSPATRAAPSPAA